MSSSSSANSSFGEVFAGNLALVAGQIGGPGNINGSGAGAGFQMPTSVAVDVNGNLYIADSENDVIRKITPAGNVSTLAGRAGVQGSADGIGPSATFSLPSSVAIDASGNLYVADMKNSTIRKIAPSGEVSTLAGSAGTNGATDGSGPAASFYYPMGVAVDTNGNVYVADTYNSAIRIITPAGAVSTFAGTAKSIGSADGTGAAARFHNPSGLALDANNNLYVADTYSNTIRAITPAGVATTLAGTAGVFGSADGTGAAASFNRPAGVAVDPNGNVYVADASNNAIRVIAPGGGVTTLAGAAGAPGWADGTGTAASFNNPSGVAFSATAGAVYVADTYNSIIRQVTPAGVVSTMAGSILMEGSADGPSAAATFDLPFQVAIDPSGNIYVADSGNSTIRKIDTTGTVSTFAGMAQVPDVTDGLGTVARFASCTGIAIDSSGNLFVADTANSTIRKITPGAEVSTFAGSAGVIGASDGVGTSALFYNPISIAIDSANNLYVADNLNSNIRKVTPAGVVTTLAGMAETIGWVDGNGSAALFNQPNGIAIDGAGNVYVADTGNSTVRKITPAGTVTTLAGLAGAVGAADGPAASARFNRPLGVAADGYGNVFVADSGNFAVREIANSGAVATVVGVLGQKGIQQGPVPASLTYLYGIAISGNALYLTTGSAVLTVNPFY